ncbi:MAG: hypothetical protein WCP30_09170 [Mycobacteriaceae bacterium]
MKNSMTAVAGVVGVTVLVGLSVSGCQTESKQSGSGTSSSSASSSASSSVSAQPADYTALLIKDTDIKAPEVFTASPPLQNPNGKPGAATSFSNPDSTHVIGDTILILPNASDAAGVLEAAKKALPDAVANATPEPVDVGTGGVTVSGNSPDGSKSVTVLLFTEGKAFTTLEFDGPPDQPAPPDFVIDVAQKQHAAIKNGLPSG